MPSFSPSKATALRIRDIAVAQKVKAQRVLEWIHSGELEATDVSRPDAKRPTWRITAEALDAFTTKRSNRAHVRPSLPRVPKATGGKTYF